MEVHHHGHVHHEKKWKSYLFQFFMLFLAVFLGFLAEYQLEHKIEKGREKEYIRLMIEDLQMDTAVLRQQIPLMNECVGGLDSLISQIYLYLDGKADTRKMYYNYHHYCRNRFDIELTQRAMNQLKNSGNMRLIHDKAAALIISSVESGFEVLKETTNFYHIRQEDAATFGLRIFDFHEYQKAIGDSYNSGNFDESKLLSLDYFPKLNYTEPVYLKEFASRLGYFRNAFQEYIRKFERAVPFVNNGISVLANNYNIELNEHYRAN